MSQHVFSQVRPGDLFSNAAGLTVYTAHGIKDERLQPFFDVSKTVVAGMTAVIVGEIVPQLLKDIPNQPDEQRLESEPYLHRLNSCL